MSMVVVVVGDRHRTGNPNGDGNGNGDTAFGGYDGR